ncbi:hypothetical protein HPP92_021925 [Vanilla planifolia]|uniref:Homoserine dehydrogenase n=1 Tax=Vanilla planifolia TaxID=51239 RepID=A0A835Q301_VANPL|nr:hypothetical protein HPP92_021925 [Vanilla planifolia]
MEVGYKTYTCYGSTILKPLSFAAVLKESFNIDLRVLGISGSKKMVLSDSGIDLTRWRDAQKENAEPAELERFVRHINDNYFLPNKYLKLKASQRKHYTRYFYEATVGAGLPIINTLQGLLETGDKILKIEGIFSGTLSYIFNNFNGTRAFSDVVAEAKNAGYTEPDPRDDLSGTDVARKVIILARESGLNLELSDIPVRSLVPEPLRACSSVEEFMRLLPNYDDEFSKEQYDAEVEGRVLRYVGIVDVANNTGIVELRGYGKDHPFAQLSGSDNIIAFTTARYNAQPLIIRGPGAGAESNSRRGFQ